MLIGELAKTANVTRDTIRFYEQAGLIQSQPRPAGTRTYNDYAPEMLARLLEIRQAQSAGFTLREIKSILDEWGDNVAAIPSAEIVRLLDAKIAQMDTKLRDLEQVRDYLREKRQRISQEIGAAQP